MSERPFVVHLNLLEGGPGQRKEFSRSGVIDEISTSVVRVPADAHVSFDGAVEWIDGGRVVITGSVSVPWVGECRRCLSEASGLVVTDVREIFEPDATEGETYELKGDVVDLEPMLREAVVLEFPLAPVVCRDDCKGLCPQCGVNRNDVECDCDTDVKDLRWAALEDLTFEDEADND
jgi:uncharacterized protein